MHYDINVGQQYKKTVNGEPLYTHFFATAPRSVTDKMKLKRVYLALKKAFPEPEFSISVSYRCESGQYISEEEILNG